MHSHSIDGWTHEHVFLGAHHDRNERRTWLVVALTVVMMGVEIAAGTLFGSMALVADGWHMSTHAVAIAVAAAAYRLARRHATDPRFTFGTGKLGELAGFSSAIILAMVALLIGYESVTRLFSPVPIQFSEAILVAVIGLAVNLASAWLLFEPDHAHDHGHAHHDHGHADHHSHRGHDTNLRAAYLHVLADALTSVLAITALLAARFFGWTWIDPAIGVVGALVIAQWSWGLIRSAGAALLDAVPSADAVADIRARLEIAGDRVSDLHLWRIGPGHQAAVVAIVSDRPQEPRFYKQRLAGVPGLSHVTVEVTRCPHHEAPGAPLGDDCAD